MEYQALLLTVDISSTNAKGPVQHDHDFLIIISYTEYCYIDLPWRMSVPLMWQSGAANE